jgi:hypothetical protein
VRNEAEGVPDEVPQQINEFVQSLEVQGLVGYETARV